MQNKLIIVFFFSLFIISQIADGQKLINSPYSRFNMGSFNPSGNFRSLSMGGTGIALRENTTIYFDNPASYSSFDTTSFVFDFGLDYSTIKLIKGTARYTSDDINFHHLLMGFPLAKGWGFATGVVPISNGYYNISQNITQGVAGYDPLTGDVTSTHKGTGGFTKFFFGTGLNITKNLSAGANLNVLFGEIDRMNQSIFADFNNTFNQGFSEKLRINGLNLEYGLQYTSNLKKDYFITAGLSFVAAKNYRSSIEQIKARFLVYTYPPYSPDTLSYINNTSKDSTRLPQTVRLGLSFGKKDKFVASVDYVISNWANARIYGSEAKMINTKSLSMGLEYIPDRYSNTSYLSRIEYRAGAHFSNDYLLLNDVRIKEFGLSCGLGIRIRKQYLSKTNVYFDFTRKRGDAVKGLPDQNMFSFGLSLNLYDNWFMKREYQ